MIFKCSNFCRVQDPDSKFNQIGQMVFEILRFFRFSRWRIYGAKELRYRLSLYRVVLRIHDLHRVAGDSVDRHDVEYSSPRLIRSPGTPAGTSGVFPMATASALPWRHCTYETASPDASEHHRGTLYTEARQPLTRHVRLHTILHCKNIRISIYGYFVANFPRFNGTGSAYVWIRKLTE